MTYSRSSDPLEGLGGTSLPRRATARNQSPVSPGLREQGSSPEQMDSGFPNSRRSSFASRESTSGSGSDGRRESVSSDEMDEIKEEPVKKAKVVKTLSKSCDQLESSKKSSLPPPISGATDLVGFGLLPDQVYRKAVKKGFEFSLMVVGESGLGKSTLVNSMFLADIYGTKEGEEDKEDRQTLQVETHHCELEENGVKLALTVIDTPGYGDAVDNTNCWSPILEYIEDQFDDFLEAETRVTRVEVPDTRVHACLYFIAPTGHGLKPLDVEFMRRIHKMVNIIPVIGKSDCCTKKEIGQFKAKILRQLDQHQIEIYNFPPSELDPEGEWMRGRLPFAVVGSNTLLVDPATGVEYRGREYPWGIVNIEDQDHCDFMPLRNLVLAHHMQDLKDVTHSRHYESFRCSKLQEMMHSVGGKGEAVSHPLATLEGEVSRDEERLDDLQSELESNFSARICERLERLQVAGNASQADWIEETGRMEEERRRLAARREELREQKKMWEKYQKMAGGGQSKQNKSLESLLGGRKLRGFVNALNSKVRQ